LRRHQLAEQPLALEQRQVSKVAPIQPQQIESVKMLRCAPPHQVIEPRPAIRVHKNDFAIDNSYVGNRGANPRGQRRKGLEDIAIPRNQAAAAGVDASARKPSSFTSKIQSGWSNGSARTARGIVSTIGVMRRPAADTLTSIMLAIAARWLM